MILDTYFRYFTKERVICLLYQKNNCWSPFRLACKLLHKHKTDTLVHDVVKQSLLQPSCSTSTSTTTTATASLSSSLNIGTAMMMATSDDNISLDGWYYFIWRQPDTMLSMLRNHRCCDDTASVILSLLSSPSSLSNNNKNTGTNGQNTGISHRSNSYNKSGINDDGTGIDRTNTNNINNEDNTTLHNNNNNNNSNNVVVRRRTTRKRKQRS